MPNSINDTGFEPDSPYAKASGDKEDLSVFGFHEDEDDEADSDEDLADDKADVNSDESDDDEIAEAAGPAIVSPLAFATVDELIEDDEELEEDLEEEDVSEDNIIISKEKIILAKQLLENIQKNSSRLASIFGGLLSEGDEDLINIAEISQGMLDAEEGDGNVVEGVFNGENMIGPDGKEYSVPANYASKSKLVEGDMLKLTITNRGTFVYKQTKPVERKRLIGKLEKDAEGTYFVSAEHKKFRVITASITYYKGVPGDKVVVLVPVSGDSAWGAVENVIKSK